MSSSIKTPVMQYQMSQLPSIISSSDHCNTELTVALKVAWQRARDAGAFRYSIRNITSQRAQGEFHSYLILLNPMRSKNRRPPEYIKHICQPFDHEKFHFGRVSEAEVLLRLRNVDRDQDMHTILINASPILEWHSLLCPSLDRCLPQVLTEDSLCTAMEVFFLANDPNLRIGFNSLCAFASVNHLHFHLVYTPKLPIEDVHCSHLVGPIYLIDYPAKAFCLQLTSSKDINQAAQDTYRLIRYCIENETAHNLLITRGKCVSGHDYAVRIVVWPRKSIYGSKKQGLFNIAVCELGGFFVAFDEKTLNIKISELEKEISAWNLENFQEFCMRVSESVYAKQ